MATDTVKDPVNGWDADALTEALSERARRAGAAYVGPGSFAPSDMSAGAGRVIAFTAGIPDPAVVPFEELIQASEAVLRRDGTAALEYGGSQGFAGLREWLAAHWSALDGLPLTAVNYMLTNGAAQALECVGQTFIDPGDIVLVEAPSFAGSIRALRSLGCRIESLIIDEDGLNPDELADKLNDAEHRGERVKLLYTIANYHNPTGALLSLERRRRMLELCARHRVLIVEDDAYGEIGFDREPLPSLYALAGGQGVLKLGSFSKTIAPGLRAGWVQASEPVIRALLSTRFDMGNSPYLMRTIAEYAAEGRLEAHIREIRPFYERKRDVMLNALRENCSSFATWSDPRGGFYAWLKLHDDIGPMRLQQFAHEEGVAYIGGAGFFVEVPPADRERIAGAAQNAGSRYVRLSYSNPPVEQIEDGVRRLARAMQRAKRK